MAAKSDETLSPQKAHTLGLALRDSWQEVREVLCDLITPEDACTFAGTRDSQDFAHRIYTMALPTAYVHAAMYRVPLLRRAADELFGKHTEPMQPLVKHGPDGRVTYQHARQLSSKKWTWEDERAKYRTAEFARDEAATPFTRAMTHHQMSELAVALCYDWREVWKGVHDCLVSEQGDILPSFTNCYDFVKYLYLAAIPVAFIQRGMYLIPHLRDAEYAILGPTAVLPPKPEHQHKDDVPHSSPQVKTEPETRVLHYVHAGGSTTIVKGVNDGPAQREAASAPPGDTTCTVCMDAKPDHAMVPCGHQCVCRKCAHDVITTAGTCPICRAKVTNAMQIFLA